MMGIQLIFPALDFPVFWIHLTKQRIWKATSSMFSMKAEWNSGSELDTSCSMSDQLIHFSHSWGSAPLYRHHQKLLYPCWNPFPSRTEQLLNTACLMRMHSSKMPWKNNFLPAKQLLISDSIKSEMKSEHRGVNPIRKKEMWEVLKEEGLVAERDESFQIHF